MDSSTQQQILNALECSSTQSDELKKCALKQIAQADFCPAPNIVAASLQAFQGEDAESEFETAMAVITNQRTEAVNKIGKLSHSKAVGQYSYLQIREELENCKRLPHVIRSFLEQGIEKVKTKRLPEIVANDVAAQVEANTYSRINQAIQLNPIWRKEIPTKAEEIEGIHPVIWNVLWTVLGILLFGLFLIMMELLSHQTV